MEIIYSLLFSMFLIITILSSISTTITVFAVNEPIKVISLDNYKFMYSVKFVCIPFVGPDKEEAFVPQNYSTVVNVHNPHSQSIFFLKKSVIAQSEDEERGPISNLVRDGLKPDQALSINCNDIVDLFNQTSSFGDGFVVLLSNEKLDVSAVYTTQSSIDVEYIKPTITNATNKLPDLTVEILGFENNCTQNGCTVDVDMKVSNLSTETVSSPFNVETTTSNGFSNIQTIPSMSGGGSQILFTKLGPGSNCHSPDCTVNAFVDNSNVVIESNENNNKDSMTSVG
jgi:hypothetical protein